MEENLVLDGQILVIRRKLDKADEVEQHWREQSEKVDKILLVPGDTSRMLRSDEEINKLLLAQPENTDTMLGLLYSILSCKDPARAEKFYQYLTWIVKDRFAWLSSRLSKFIAEKWCKLSDLCKTQILWMVNTFVREDIKTVGESIKNLLKLIGIGDVSESNLMLASQMLEILTTHRKFLYASSSLPPHAFYTFVTLIPDHADNRFVALRTREIQFCTKLFREKFQEIRGIGRDLVRLMLNCKVPEFNSLWREVITNPTSFAGDFTSPYQLLLLRTPRIYVASRLTFEAEQWLTFLMKRVSFKQGNYIRYQEWFRAKYLTAELSENAIPELIRYLCCVFHPDNQMLASDLVPRWAIISWLLKCCKTPQVVHNAKEALLYDFLFFPRTTEDFKVMNVEPAVLLMFNSVKLSPLECSALLEFLFSSIDRMEKVVGKGADVKVRDAIKNSFDMCIKVGMIRTMNPIMTGDYSPALKAKLGDANSPFKTWYLVAQQQDSSNQTTGLTTSQQQNTQ